MQCQSSLTHFILFFCFFIFHLFYVQSSSAISVYGLAFQEKDIILSAESARARRVCVREVGLE